MPGHNPASLSTGRRCKVRLSPVLLQLYASLCVRFLLFNFGDSLSFANIFVLFAHCCFFIDRVFVLIVYTSLHWPVQFYWSLSALSHTPSIFLSGFCALFCTPLFAWRSARGSVVCGRVGRTVCHTIAAHAVFHFSLYAMCSRVHPRPPGALHPDR